MAMAVNPSREQARLPFSADRRRAGEGRCRREGEPGTESYDEEPRRAAVL